MTLPRRFVSVLAIGLGALSAAACVISTEDNKIIVEPAVRYNGTPETKTLAWASGQPISIFNDNGDIVVSSSATATEVRAVAKPFAMGKNGEADKASDTMETKLNLKVALENGEIIVAATMAGSGMYGYDLDVEIPAGFDDWLDVQQQNGKVTLNGVGHSKGTRVNSNNGSIVATKSTLTNKIELTTANGSIDANILPTGSDKSLVRTDNGDVDIGIPAGANLTIHAFSERGTVEAPEDWAKSGEDSNYSFTLGDGSTALEISTGWGDVKLR